MDCNVSAYKKNRYEIYLLYFINFQFCARIATIPILFTYRGVRRPPLLCEPTYLYHSQSFLKIFTINFFNYEDRQAIVLCKLKKNGTTKKTSRVINKATKGSRANPLNITMYSRRSFHLNTTNLFLIIQCHCCCVQA